MAAKTVTLLSCDGKTFTVDAAVARMSLQVCNTLEECGDGDGPVPLPNVDGATLAKVLEFCVFHSTTPARAEAESKAFDTSFKQDMSMETMEKVMMAANFMNIASLLGVMAECIADKIKGKSPQEIRETFGITNDFTPEEEAAVLEENAWALVV